MALLCRNSARSTHRRRQFQGTRLPSPGAVFMTSLSRRGLILSGAALATGAFIAPAEAATGSISIRVVSAGFILGFSGGSGTLVFEGRQYPLGIGGVSAG